MTMSAADMLDQWFETDPLKATMSAAGIIGTFLGVRSPGTAYVLLHHYMGEIDGAFRSWGFSRGGTGAISMAIAGAAQEAGVEIRTEAPIEHIKVEGRPRHRRGADGRRRDRTPASWSRASTRASPSSGSWTPSDLPAEFLEDVRRYKYRGLVGQGEPRALDGLPDFTCLPGPGAAPARRHLHLARRRVHGARLRRREVRRLLAPAVHRHGDPLAHRSVGRPARQARPVLLRAVRALQARARAPGTRSARPSATPWSTRIAEYAPNLKKLILHRQVLTPLDLEREFSLTEGNIFQGELTPRAALLPAAGAGLGALPHPARRTSTCAAPPPTRAAASWARPAAWRALEMLKDWSRGKVA